MANFPIVAVILLISTISPSWGAIDPTDENAAKEWYNKYNEMAQRVFYTSSEASWNYNTNITNHTQSAKVDADLVEAAFNLEAAANSSIFEWRNFENTTLKRLFQSVNDIGSDALGKNDTDKLKKLRQLEAEMESIYSKGTVCNGTDCLNLEPGLTKIMTESRDKDTLLWAWKGWRDSVGKNLKTKYEEFVGLNNEAAVANGYKNAAEDWISSYEMPVPDFKDMVKKLYFELRPLYMQLHSYVRRKLNDTYGKDNFPPSGHIPAHLLGNMWAQTWSNLLDIMQPYNKTSVDVTPAMIKQGYNATKMFQVSEEFFTSLGLFGMPQEFWVKSMLTKPDNREVVCHASAWDFYNQKDFRIKMCTTVKMEDLITVHHEMGHVEYYLQYKDQPISFRSGANPGFHEAVGDVLALSVSTPAHLKKIGLLDSVQNDTEANINYMLSIALDKIAFLPFGYLMDSWRWSVFEGETKADKYNHEWWRLRECLQGISAATNRTEDDFDPGAKYHIPANVPYIRYFVSFVLQFQLHEALCKAANQNGALHECDIYQSKEAGKLLSDMLKLGSSKPWPEALEMVTGTREISASSLVKYFEPLKTWLEEQNEGHRVGWDIEAGCPQPSDSPTNPPASKGVKVPINYYLLLLVFILFKVAAAGHY